MAYLDAACLAIGELEVARMYCTLRRREADEHRQRVDLQRQVVDLQNQVVDLQGHVVDFIQQVVDVQGQVVDLKQQVIGIQQQLAHAELDKTKAIVQTWLDARNLIATTQQQAQHHDGA